MTTTTALDQLRASLADTLTRNLRIVLQLTADVPEAAALAPLVAGGSHMNWLVGHLVSHRDAMLTLLGQEAVRPEPEDEAHAYGSHASDRPAFTLAQQVRAFELTDVPLQAALAAVTSDQLAQPAGRRKAGERLEFLVWHETYHLGQLMLYRRAAGLDSPIG